MLSVSDLGFEDICLLTQHGRLICTSCSSNQRFACGFLQIPPHGGHPCRPANGSPDRARRETSHSPSECALPGAQKKAALPEREGRQKSRHCERSEAISLRLLRRALRSSQRRGTTVVCCQQSRQRRQGTQLQWKRQTSRRSR